MAKKTVDNTGEIESTNRPIITSPNNITGITMRRREFMLGGLKLLLGLGLGGSFITNCRKGSNYTPSNDVNNNKEVIISDNVLGSAFRRDKATNIFVVQERKTNAQGVDVIEITAYYIGFKNDPNQKASLPPTTLFIELDASYFSTISNYTEMIGEQLKNDHTKAVQVDSAQNIWAIQTGPVEITSNQTNLNTTSIDIDLAVLQGVQNNPSTPPSKLPPFVENHKLNLDPANTAEILKKLGTMISF